MSEPNAATSTMISALGNWVGDTILFPLDTISTRLKASKHVDHGALSFAINTICEEKFKLFRGVQLAFPAAFIPNLIYLSVYDTGMSFVEKYIKNNNASESMKLIFPFFVSSLAQLITLFPYLPVDTVRTRVQMNKPEYEYNSFFSALKNIQEKEGFSRFYKSSKIYFLSKTLYTAIQFQSFEMIRYFAGPSPFWMIVNTLASTAIAVSFVNPLEVLITRYALVDTTKKKIVFRDIVHRIYHREGIKGFYKGYGTEIAYNCTYALFWLPLYQIVREKFGLPEENSH